VADGKTKTARKTKVADGKTKAARYSGACTAVGPGVVVIEQCVSRQACREFTNWVIEQKGGIVGDGNGLVVFPLLVSTGRAGHMLDTEAKMVHDCGGMDTALRGYIDALAARARQMVSAVAETDIDLDCVDIDVVMTSGSQTATTRPEAATGNGWIILMNPSLSARSFTRFSNGKTTVDYSSAPHTALVYREDCGVLVLGPQTYRTAKTDLIWMIRVTVDVHTPFWCDPRDSWATPEDVLDLTADEDDVSGADGQSKVNVEGTGSTDEGDVPDNALDSEGNASDSADDADGGDTASTEQEGVDVDGEAGVDGAEGDPDVDEPKSDSNGDPASDGGEGDDDDELSIGGGAMEDVGPTGAGGL
jgi:hypothetical protein